MDVGTVNPGTNQVKFKSKHEHKAAEHAPTEKRSLKDKLHLSHVTKKQVFLGAIGVGILAIAAKFGLPRLGWTKIPVTGPDVENIANKGVQTAKKIVITD